MDRIRKLSIDEDKCRPVLVLLPGLPLDLLPCTAHPVHTVLLRLQLLFNQLKIVSSVPLYSGADHSLLIFLHSLLYTHLKS